MRTLRWDQMYSSAETNETVRELAFWHLSEVSGSAVRAEITRLVWANDYAALCSFEIDYKALSPHDAYHLSQTLAFYRKREDLEIGVNKEEVARVKFKEAEELCSETNGVFRLWDEGQFYFDPSVEVQLFAAQRKISHVLGELPPISELKLRFGPGATTDVKKQEASPRVKLGKRFSCSEDLIPLLPELLAEMPSWVFGKENLSVESDYALVPVDIVHGRLHFVPKNAKTYRAIVVEPMLNSMLQLGIGEVIARRLRRVGVDIRDQTRNQRLARVGSLTNGLATVDLSSASDTISRGLVKHLLPPDWFDFLDYCRTSQIEDGDRVLPRSHKFSSMGNGFTFPLETLIFWALARSVTRDEDAASVSVYGDDIIVPTYAYPDLCKLLRACGFVVNLDKSFADGPFRESCGKDYHSGIDIRPVFVRDRICGADLFTLHNFYVRCMLPEPAQLVLNHIAPEQRIMGPDGYGDGHLIGDHQSAMRPHKREHGWSGYTFETFSWVGRKKFVALPGDYVYPLYCIYMGGPINRPDPFMHPRFERLFVTSAEDKDPRRVSLVRLLRDFQEPPVHGFYNKGVLGHILPGTQGYKRIKIYTLSI